MGERGVCMFCGAYSQRGCAYYFDNDLDPDMGGAPCEEMDEEDVFGPEELDPDRLREDRDERRQLDKEYGE